MTQPASFTAVLSRADLDMIHDALVLLDPIDDDGDDDTSRAEQLAQVFDTLRNLEPPASHTFHLTAEPVDV